MSKFLYLFWNKDGTAGRPTSPEEIERVMTAWMSWLNGLQQSGHLVQRGERLDITTGKVVRGKAKTVTDGPYAESKDSIGGYVMVEAKDLDQAVELSKGCPIFELNGSVEVRPVVSP
jgi:hypothetical protein